MATVSISCRSDSQILFVVGIYVGTCLLVTFKSIGFYFWFKYSGCVRWKKRRIRFTVIIHILLIYVRYIKAIELQVNLLRLVFVDKKLFVYTLFLK